MEGYLKKISEEFTELEKAENEARSTEVDMRHSLEKFETVLKENQQKVKHWQKEVSAAPGHLPQHLGRLVESPTGKSSNREVFILVSELENCTNLTENKPELYVQH